MPHGGLPRGGPNDLICRAEAATRVRTLWSTHRLAVETVRDLAAMPRADWLERTIDAIHRQAPQREAAMREALVTAIPQSVVLFVTDGDEPGKTRIDALRWLGGPVAEAVNRN